MDGSKEDVALEGARGCAKETVNVHFGTVGPSVESFLSACRVRLFLIWQIIALKYMYIRAKQPS